MNLIFASIRQCLAIMLAQFLSNAPKFPLGVHRWVTCKVKFDDREAEPDDEEKHILMYRVFIRNCEVSQNVVESWKNRYKFDDLAFGNAVHGKVNVRILEVVKL